MRSAVLFLVFNRPDTTRRVFEQIRIAQPPKLYIAADGPRDNKCEDMESCAEVRSIFSKIDWNCEIKTLFQPFNLGCKKGVSAGIDWFFRHEEEGIILEDDVLPHPSFFEFCDELLDRYRIDERVGMISGSNLISSRIKSPHSYFFSKVPLIWGWASWRRSWKNYDVNLSEWPSWGQNNGIEKIFGKNLLVSSYWKDALDRVYSGELNTWDYQLMFSQWRHESLTVLPANNLTDNLGYGENATHTSSKKPDYLIQSPVKELRFPLNHPSAINSSNKIDLLIFQHVHKINLIGFIRRKLRPIKKFILNRLTNANI